MWCPEINIVVLVFLLVFKAYCYLFTFPLFFEKRKAGLQLQNRLAGCLSSHFQITSTVSFCILLNVLSYIYFVLTMYVIGKKDLVLFFTLMLMHRSNPAEWGII